MKTLQNNFTTPEQSKRLLELGVPKDSADCYYETFCSDNQNDFRLELRQNPLELSNNLFSDYHHLIPCWSVGRLIEIMLLCHISDDAGIMFDKPLYEVSNCTNIEWCIRVLESSIKYSHIDFSKLEE